MAQAVQAPSDLLRTAQRISGRERVSPVRPIRLRGVLRSGFPIVFESHEFDLGPRLSPIDNRVTCVRTSSLHIVQWRIVAVRLQANASRIHRPNSTRKRNDSWNVCVAAENQRRSRVAQTFLDTRGRSQTHAAGIHIFQQILQIVRGRAVAQQDVFIQQMCRRKLRQPCKVSAIQLPMRGSIR